MNELQEQTILRSMEYDKKYVEMQQKLASANAQHELAQKFTNKELSSLSGQLEHLLIAINTYKEYVKDMLNFSSVINHIVIQD